MKTLWLVIQREYFSRVRKRSFILLTLLGPLLVALVYGGIIALVASEGTPSMTVNIVDQSELNIAPKLIRETRNANLTFVTTESDYFKAQERAGKDGDWDAVLFINPDPLNVKNGINLMYGGQKPPQSIVRDLEWALTRVVEQYKLSISDIDKDEYTKIRSQVVVHLQPIKELGAKDTDVQGYVAFIASILIYLFIMLYGVQVLRGVQEEKTNRIIEVMVSSVRPFHLMMGKVIGIGAVGLTQFIVWTGMSAVFLQIISIVFLGFADPADISQKLLEMEQYNVNNMSEDTVNLSALADILAGTNFALMGFAFILFFVLGFLLYGALFAAIGAMIDSESDTQQFMMPVTLPLMLAYVAAIIVLMNPGSVAGKIFSFIPFTSPVVMMVRLPHGVGIWTEFIPSIIILIISFIGITWLAARIYRVGILSYGKKPKLKDIVKWIRYK